MSEISLHLASMLDWLAAYDGEPFDACVTDPPYELGFMGKGWDSTGIAFQVETWRRVFDVLKPGAHLVAFSGTRTYHRMACAIEDAGFEIRDQLAWTYGSGFPKSLDVEKGIDRTFCGCGGRGGKDHACPSVTQGDEWQGWGTALKPAWEPICLARKPLIGTVAANVLAHGTGAINVHGCRVGTEGGTTRSGQADYPKREDGTEDRTGSWARTGHQIEALNAGRFPANLIHDGSDEVLAGFPDTTTGSIAPHHKRTTSKTANTYGKRAAPPEEKQGDSGSAGRFFYSAKAGPLDRIGTAHATVKPVDLMRWLCRLITPPGGRILEPFAGSGTTGIAAMVEGFDCTMIELMPEHVTDIERKLAYLRGEGGASVIEQHRARIERAKVKGEPEDHGPLFG